MFFSFQFCTFFLSTTRPFQCLGRLDAFVFLTNSKTRARSSDLPDRSKIVIVNLPDQPFKIRSKEAVSPLCPFVLGLG
jgi:hypothetical protein